MMRSAIHGFIDSMTMESMNFQSVSRTAWNWSPLEFGQAATLTWRLAQPDSSSSDLWMEMEMEMEAWSHGDGDGVMEMEMEMPLHQIK